MRIFTVIICLCMITLSCRKKDPPAETPEEPVAPAPEPTYPVTDYMKVKATNYWIYEVKEIDTNNVTVSTRIDSVYPGPTYIRRGRTFYQLYGSPITVGMLTDSADCLINEFGAVVFQVNPKNDTLWHATDTTIQLETYGIMQRSSFTYSYAGKNYERCRRCNYIYKSSVLNPKCAVRTYHNVRCPGVGLVSGTYAYAQSCSHFEASLIRYKVD